MQRVACPILVSRDEELAVLEEALLAANRGDGRLVAVAGEAGMGKTRLVTELTRRAKKLGFTVLWGGCSEVDLSLPYLPFIEALGNYIDAWDAAVLVKRLGPAAKLLAQLFPQLGTSADVSDPGDPASAKTRLFEAVVSLLGIAAREHGLLLVVDDAHWADASTRELLDHLARRLPSMRALTIVTYRSDEIERRHPLLPMLQAWRRSRLVETIDLASLSGAAVVAMIRAILDEDAVTGELATLMHHRCEGNPFVLEEMLREAIDRGDIYRSGDGWDRKPIELFGIPRSVSDTIVLRLGRLDPAHVTILESAAVLGRRFSHATLAAVTDDLEDVVFAALESALGQQLIEEDPQRPGDFRWRHALTQEAIYDEIVLPRRQRMHSRAADALVASAAAERAHHLLRASRFAEAVEESLRAAEEAEAAAAHVDAVLLYERALPHVTDPRVHAQVLCRQGLAEAFCQRPGRAVELLSEGARELEALGDDVLAARYRLHLVRAWWVLMQLDKGAEEAEKARRVLEPLGPSRDLAYLYFLEASQKLFANDFAGSLEGLQRVYEIADSVGAEREKLQALSFKGLALADIGAVEQGLETIEQAYLAAVEGGHVFVALNTQWNEGWMRSHLMLAGAEKNVARQEALQEQDPGSAVWTPISRSYVSFTRGRLAEALEDAEWTVAESTRLAHSKLLWRGRVQAGKVLAEMGRVEEALARLPWPPLEEEAQDHIYEGPAQIHARLAAGHVDEAVVMADVLHRRRHLVAGYAETLAAGIEAFLAAGQTGKAQDLLDAGVAAGFPAGGAWLDEARARLLLAADDAPAALAVMGPAIDQADAAAFRVAATRMRILAGQAAIAAGDLPEAERLLRRAAADADDMDARLLSAVARDHAGAGGIDIPEMTPAASRDDEFHRAGERMITSLFADIRGFTAMTGATPPEELHARLIAFYRLAKMEVERHGGIIDKFAGDAVMATFNADGSSVDHPLRALKTALGLRDRAALMDLPIGVGIAVGAAVVGEAVEGGNRVTLGSSVNLAARLQAVAGAAEVVLSQEAHRRVARWLDEHGLAVVTEELTLKGFDQAQTAMRIPAATAGVVEVAAT